MKNNKLIDRDTAYSGAMSVVDAMATSHFNRLLIIRTEQIIDMAKSFGLDHDDRQGLVDWFNEQLADMALERYLWTSHEVGLAAKDLHKYLCDSRPSDKTTWQYLQSLTDSNIETILTDVLNIDYDEAELNLAATIARLDTMFIDWNRDHRDEQVSVLRDKVLDNLKGDIDGIIDVIIEQDADNIQYGMLDQLDLETIANDIYNELDVITQ